MRIDDAQQELHRIYNADPQGEYKTIIRAPGMTDIVVPELRIPTDEIAANAFEVAVLKRDDKGKDVEILSGISVEKRPAMTRKQKDGVNPLDLGSMFERAMKMQDEAAKRSEALVRKEQENERSWLMEFSKLQYDRYERTISDLTEKLAKEREESDKRFESMLSHMKEMHEKDLEIQRLKMSSDPSVKVEEMKTQRTEKVLEFASREVTPAFSKLVEYGISKFFAGGSTPPPPAGG